MKKTFIVPTIAFVLGLGVGVLLMSVPRMNDGAAEGSAETPDVKSGRVRSESHRRAEKRDAESDEETNEEEGEFVEAVDADQVVEEETEEATVEEVRDEDGLTIEERAEKFKRENPEEWERIQKRRAAALEAARKVNAQKQDFLDTIDEKFLTADQKKEHAVFAEALAARNAARERINVANASGKEVAPADYRAYSEAERTLHAKANDERQLLLEAAARSLGLAGDDVPTFLNILKDIDSCTRDLH